jgi:hypothetical protein
MAKRLPYRRNIPTGMIICGDSTLTVAVSEETSVNAVKTIIMTILTDNDIASTAFLSL